MTTQANALQSAGADGQPLFRILADAVLLDIEGTISPVSFVRDTLFPYSKKRIADYVAANVGRPVVQEILARTAALAEGATALGTLIDWQERDVKAAPLKKLQGLIWENGYRSGELKSPVFSDSLQAVKIWKTSGLPLYIYSSGSVQAQQLFFEFNFEGDLRPLFSGYFDTDVGAKTEPFSYLRISERVRSAPESIVFFSDNTKELDAAQTAGFLVIHVVKDGTESDSAFPHITDFSQVEITRSPRR